MTAILVIIGAWMIALLQAADDGGVIRQGIKRKYEFYNKVELNKISDFDTIDGTIVDLQPGKVYHVIIRRMLFSKPYSLYDTAAPAENLSDFGCVLSDSAWWHVLRPFLSVRNFDGDRDIRDIQIKFRTEPPLAGVKDYKAVVVIEPESISVGQIARTARKLSWYFEQRRHAADNGDSFWVMVGATSDRPRLNVRYRVMNGYAHPQQFHFVESAVESGEDKVALPQGWHVISVASIKAGRVQVRALPCNPTKSEAAHEVSFETQTEDHASVRIVWEVNQVQAEYLRTVAARGQFQINETDLLISTIAGN